MIYLIRISTTKTTIHKSTTSKIVIDNNNSRIKKVCNKNTLGTLFKYSIYSQE